MNSNGAKPWKSVWFVILALATSFLAGMGVTGWFHASDSNIHAIDVTFPVLVERMDRMQITLNKIDSKVTELNKR